MPSSVCFILICRTSKHNAKLLRFPRNDTLREEWVKRIASHFPQIVRLNKNQLMSRLVCSRHFEPRFLVLGQSRLYNGCPTLISEDEILTGIPISPMDVVPDTDHTYSQVLPMTEHSYSKSLAENIEVDFSSTGLCPALPSTSLEMPKIQLDNAQCDQEARLSPAKPIKMTSSKRMCLVHSLVSLTPKCR